MKTQFALIVSGLLISCNCALGQKPGQAPPVANPLPAPGVAFPRAVPDDSLTRFDLDFPGGTPEQLVRSIEKASGKPVNVVIPPEHADVQLPKLKMKDVTVPQLFAALGAASTRTIAVPDLQNFGARNAFAQAYQGYGFE